MAEPLWRCFDSNKCLSRPELELIMQKKKVSEIYQWFEDHFKNCSTPDYIKRCPIVIFQGPTGCGKTSTLKCIANELKIPVKEYSETTDVTAINLELTRYNRDDEDLNGNNTSLNIDRRKALKFEHFVMNSLRYNTLYSADDPPADADSDCEFDDSFVDTAPKPKGPPPITGVIVLVDTPLTFAKRQRILIKTFQNLIRAIQNVSRYLTRRIAIVFESLEGDNETIPLPTKVKLSFGIQTFKLNPIIRTNMKKFIEALVKNYKHIMFDKETIEQLVNDCEGDLRACINTLQIICNKSDSVNGKMDYNTDSQGFVDAEGLFPYQMSAIKKQKTYHGKVRFAEFTPSLMRDNTKGTNFFHALGKIFYQKRLYPELDIEYLRNNRIYRSIDRPYPTENSTDYLASLIDAEPKNLIAWLHNYYHKYCSDLNIEKAALFLDNLSTTDATSINSLQSSQFYEMHSSLEQIQICLAIESTVYSLYENRYNSPNTTSCKKTNDNKRGQVIIKPSVENSKTNFFSYHKPVSMSIPKVAEDYQTILAECTSKMIEMNQTCFDPITVLVDYAPYMRLLSDARIGTLAELRKPENHPIFDDEKLDSCFRALQKFEVDNEEIDFEIRHERLQELIDGFL